jgi:hypothetical protein
MFCLSFPYKKLALNIKIYKMVMLLVLFLYLDFYPEGRTCIISGQKVEKKYYENIIGEA